MRSNKNEINKVYRYFEHCDYRLLLKEMGWEPDSLIQHWLSRNAENIASDYWTKETKNDWKWALGISLLSLIERYQTQFSKPLIIGLSALPGCGKSTLGRWLDKAASEFNLSTKVISLDDFYYPSEDLIKKMQGNPWNVPRGLPGSHSTYLIKSSLENFLDKGTIHYPIFDKSLRGGKGDRIGWGNSEVKILVLEGWFVGCKDLSDEDFHLIDKEPDLIPSLTKFEKEYRIKVQQELKGYVPIWDLFDTLWLIKPQRFSFTKEWKVSQEKRMLETKGSALSGNNLTSFIRMIEAAIPRSSFEQIDSDVSITINQSRDIIDMRCKSNFN